jgi:hypothetical protein
MAIPELGAGPVEPQAAMSPRVANAAGHTKWSQRVRSFFIDATLLTLGTCVFGAALADGKTH